MRAFRINYDSMEGMWLVYLGVFFGGASLLYPVFFMSRWPFPPLTYVAFLLSFLVGGGIVCIGYMNRGGEVQVRVSYLTAGMILYLAWYVLYIRLTAYGSANVTTLAVLTAPLAASLLIFLYALSVRDGLTFKIRR
ncbi:MAG: hypothetical protein AB7D42_00330 [Candidatus Methanomethylophilaceae archaeon]|nr:hypothetical protein [Candidatus Methanomethylophilaceae archaeon]